MNKMAILGIILINISFAKSVIATQNCEAFNNLKHSKNSHHEKLKVGKEYQIMQEQRGNYFIKVPNAKPQNRWVEKSCFASGKVEAKEATLAPQTTKEIKSSKSINSNTISALVLSWQNTFCETHSNKKECRQKIGASHLVLHGLWPQPRNNQYCNVPKKLIEIDKQKRWNALPDLDLNSTTKALLEQYMPGYKSNLHKHEWIKHGTCYGIDANSYFYNALTMTKKIDNTIGEYLRENIGKKIKTINIKLLASKLIDPKMKSHLGLKCKKRLLSELWINLRGQGNNIKELTKNAPTIRSNCVEAVVDAPGKFKRGFFR